MHESCLEYILYTGRPIDFFTPPPRAPVEVINSTLTTNPTWGRRGKYAVCNVTFQLYLWVRSIKTPIHAQRKRLYNGDVFKRSPHNVQRLQNGDRRRLQNVNPQKRFMRPQNAVLYTTYTVCVQNADSHNV